jgi:hypothetical protein
MNLLQILLHLILPHQNLANSNSNSIKQALYLNQHPPKYFEAFHFIVEPE